MNIKKYIIFSSVFIFAIALYVWNLDLGDYTFNLFAYSWTYSVFAWFLAPLVLMFLFSLTHIIFYSLVAFFNNKTQERDIKKLHTFVKDKILKNKVDLSVFKTEYIKELARFMNHVDMDVVESDYDFDTDISSDLKHLIQIKQGKYIPAKKIALDEQSPYYQQNIENKINTKPSYAKEIFKSTDENISDESKCYALCEIIKSNKMSDIQDIIQEHKLCKKGFLALIKKDAKNLAKNKDEALSNNDILAYSKDIKFDEKDYYEIAKAYIKDCDPDRLINLFDDFRSQNELATNAYLFILAEYEMLDKLRDIVAFLKPNEAKIYRALLDLKDASKQYKISDFIDL